MFTPIDILDVAIQLERNGEKVFREAVQRACSPELAEMLERIADEEEAHIEWFTDMRQKYSEPFTDPAIQAMGRDILQEALEGASFDLKKVDFSKIEDVRQLLNVSIEFEKDTAIFYELLQNFVDDDETRELLQSIIDEEHNHARLMREFVESTQNA